MSRRESRSILLRYALPDDHLDDSRLIFHGDKGRVLGGARLLSQGDEPDKANLRTVRGLQYVAR